MQIEIEKLSLPRGIRSQQGASLYTGVGWNELVYTVPLEGYYHL